ncbi:MAG: stage II sporulation protein P [Agathobacter sp.]|nr:stage II sporulation protein P [Agathobacter sp.]
MAPCIYTQGKTGKELVYMDMERFFVPLVSEFRTTSYEAMVKEEAVIEENWMTEEDVVVKEDTQIKEDEPVATKPQESITEKPEESVQTSGEVAEKVVVINRGKLQEFDYLRQNFYQVDNTTTVGSDLLDVNQLLGKDMTLKENVEGPQILIYHTHSQEGYKDSIPGDPATSVVGVGDYLEQLLEQKYGIEVLHHKGVYDLPSRDNAYSSALPNIEKVLQENPTIEVVIDLHRDGIAEDRHLITEVNGKPTAKIMFFNGLSKTTSQGALDYLPNPYIADNLALSFQMQLTAAEYYPGLTRKIYLKGYRYNLHLCPKSVLVEVGAQTNTFEEAKNAMEPLADILGKVVYNGIYKE